MNYSVYQIWGSLQPHRVMVGGGSPCPVIGTTDFGLPRIVIEYNL